MLLSTVGEDGAINFRARSPAPCPPRRDEKPGPAQSQTSATSDDARWARARPLVNSPEAPFTLAGGSLQAEKTHAFFHSVTHAGDKGPRSAPWGPESPSWGRALTRPPPPPPPPLPHQQSVTQRFSRERGAPPLRVPRTRLHSLPARSRTGRRGRARPPAARWPHAPRPRQGPPRPPLVGLISGGARH